MSRHHVVFVVLACMLLGFATHGQAPAPPPPPVQGPPSAPDVKQVSVSVKVVEFQTTHNMETGLSAYFLRSSLTHPWGRITTEGNVRNADLTFPTSGSSITVFLDNLRLHEGDIEVILQALENQNRAFILAQPRAMVPIGSPAPTTIKTAATVPYQNTVVVGATASQITSFRDTGVSMQVSIPEVIDDDGNPQTTEDVYIKLLVSASVNEQGGSIVVGLNEQNSGGIFGPAGIQAPTFVSRSVATPVWVRNGQVLILGGLYRSTKGKNLATLPWLKQSEDMVLGLAGHVIPGDSLGNPLSSTLGNRVSQDGRRELVFLIRAELWRPAFTVSPDFNKEAVEKDEKKKPSLTGVLEGITEIPQGIVQGITGDKKDDGVESNLGGGK